MNVVKCKNGHFFDADTYEICPHCKDVIANNPSERSATKEKDLKKKSLWKHREKSAKKEYKDIERTGTISLEFESLSDDSKDFNDHLEQNAVKDSKYQEDEKTLKTVNFWQSSSDIKSIDNNDNREIEYADESKTDSKNDTTETEQREKEELSAENSKSLQDVVKKASANSEGKTLSYFNMATMSNQTGNQDVNSDSVDPVVGWLVCIAGKHFGESFNIGAGKNSMGRSEENRIVFGKDDSISRTKHALIIYEPKKRNFYLQPGDSSGLTYLNDNYIVEAQKLCARDIIELGNSKLLFIPLCDENFTWEDYMHKE